jgi:DNA helicase-2/ATP-dependent DNA helicase PcrA
LVNFEEFKKIFEASWLDEWFDSKENKEEYLAKGRDFIKLFYEENKDKELTTLALEKGFNFKMGGGKPTELYSFKGFIDRIDILPDGTAELIDYKTGQPKEKLTFEEKEQLLLYQYAGQKIPDITANHPISKLTFYYLGNNTQLSFLGNEKDLAKLEERSIATVDEIRTSKFEATPEFHKCSFCDFKNICEFRV